MNEDLGRIVTTHTKPWIGNAVLCAVLLGLMYLIVRYVGAVELWLLLVAYPVFIVLFVGGAIVSARRTRVIVREDGLEWHHAGDCQRVRWTEIQGVEHRPSVENVMFLAIDAPDQPQLVLPAVLRDFRGLREAVENRRPTQAALPAAKARLRA